MCLTLENEHVQPKIAEEDIIVYKILDKFICLDNKYHNEIFTGVILGSECEGKISIENNRTYFCTNNSQLDGNSADNKLGYKYSWEFDKDISSIKVNNITIIEEYNILEEIPYIISYKTPYQYYPITVGETYIANLAKTNKYVEEGLHSFAAIDNQSYTLTSRGGELSAAAKCIIPKGSKYYEGTFNNDISYASNTLTYLEIIK